jgi:cysteine desulfurase/selenocysteine lyase
MSTGEGSPGSLSDAPTPQLPTPQESLLATQIAELANALFKGSALQHGGPLDVSGVAATPPTALPVHALAPAGAPAVVPASPAASFAVPAPPPGIGPNAAHLGAGGVSSAQSLPPVPGFLHTPPLASAPAPKASDLRSIPTQLAEQFGTPSPIALASGDASAPTPYYLGIAGLPAGLAPAAPGGVLPSTFPGPGAAAPALPGAQGFSGLPAQSVPFVAPPPAGSPAAASSAPYARVPGSPGAASGSFPVPDTNAVGAAPHAGSASAVPDASAPYYLSSAGAPSPAQPARGTGYDFRPELSAADNATKPGIFDPHAVRRDFPILQERVHGRPLIWFDNAATTQKPNAVIERLSYFYEHENSNIHRAAHALAARATDAYEGARDKVRRFLNASSPQEIVFVRGTTEGINLVAKSWGHRNVRAGDEIVISWLEHHANIVPWQQLCAEKGARLCVAPVDDDGQIILEEYEKLITPKTRLVSVSQVSNALGTITPVKEMVAIARRHGAHVLVDGAQAVSHMAVDVQDLDCDFYVFSGHKVFGPTGIGAVYGKRAVLEAMPPWQGGGNMISDVTFEKTTYHGAPQRFEAGTGNIADAVGLGAAIDYVTAIGLPNIGRYEHELLEYATGLLLKVPGLHLIGTAPNKAGVLSFVLDGQRTEDVGAALDREGIAVRAGHHCAQPILRRFGHEQTVRASLAPYNTPEDVDALFAALKRIQAGRPQRGL